MEKKAFFANKNVKFKLATLEMMQESAEQLSWYLRIDKKYNKFRINSRKKKEEILQMLTSVKSLFFFEKIFETTLKQRIIQSFNL